LSESDTAPDRLLVVAGASLFSTTVPLAMTGAGSVWARFIPADGEGKVRDVRVMLDVQIGTIDELVEHYRAQLTEAYRHIAPTLPPEQNDALAAMSSGKSVTVCCKASPVQLARHPATAGPAGARQSNQTRDVLAKLVATYLNHCPVEDADGKLTSMLPPTCDPGHVQRLIAALVVLKEDQTS